jgi:hypothetical protein
MGRLALTLLVLLAACSKDGAAGNAVEAWRRAGLEPGPFARADAVGDGTCNAGTVAGIATTLCEYPDAAAAKRAESVGLAKVEGATGLALAEGKLLLVLADRERKDPHGKTINEIAKIFRNR